MCYSDLSLRRLGIAKCWIKNKNKKETTTTNKTTTKIKQPHTHPKQTPGTNIPLLGPLSNDNQTTQAIKVWENELRKDCER